MSIKGTSLLACSATGFSAILLCCELCQAVQVHKRYRDPLRLYSQGLTSLNTQPFQIIQPTGLKLLLYWKMRYIVNLTMKPVPICLWCHLTPVLVREDSTVLQHGWDEVDEACWLVKNNVQVLYMHKSLPWNMLGKMFQRKEIHNKLQLTECSWMNESEITRNTGEIFPILVNGSSNKQILQSNSLSSSSWSTLHYTKCVRRIVIYIL